MKARGIDGTIYSHPIGLNGHGAGPLIGLWDYQDGVPGRGDAKVIPSMWFSIELQATTPVPEWGGQPVRMAQEEDAIVGADGKIRWALRAAGQIVLDPLRRAAAGGRILRAAGMVTSAAQLGDVAGLLAVFAAVLAEFAVFLDGATAGGVGALFWCHGQTLLSAIVAPHERTSAVKQSGEAQEASRGRRECANRRAVG